MGNTGRYFPPGKYREIPPCPILPKWEIPGNTHFGLQYMYKMMGKIPKHTSETSIYLD